jgi:hypothetical protein
MTACGGFHGNYARREGCKERQNLGAARLSAKDHGASSIGSVTVGEVALHWDRPASELGSAQAQWM